MRVSAPAKINLFLAVGARAQGGLHELASVMQAVSLADEVELGAGEGFSVSVTPPDEVAPGDDNLAVRAGRVLAAAHGVEAGARIEVRKAIPVAAGLAGGSADAAATLVGLNELWGVRASRKSLENLAAEVGSDVPFCVNGGTALVRGTGEMVSPMPVRGSLWWVLVVPPGGLSTGAVYQEFDRLGGGAGLDDPWELSDALARGDLARVAGSLRNDLLDAARSLSPAITAGREALLDAGALAAQLTGSGSAWCGLVSDEEHARAVAGRAGTAYERVFAVRSVSHGARIVER